jgi:predicted SAM-dependent methyltransferase
VKLNLGCGDDIREGYVNVDFRQTHPSVQMADLSVFPWPFEDGSADEILMLDFLEHFPYRQTQRILLECFRILKADGQVVIQVPDAMHLTAALCKKGSYLCNKCGGQMYGLESGEFIDACKKCGQSVDDIAHAAMMRLYGGQDFVGNFHQTCFTVQSLERVADAAGLSFMSLEEKDHQYANWNFKIRFEKGDVW